MQFIGLTLDVLGSVLIGFAALRVHHRFLNEHKVDQKVFRSMKREQWLGISGIVLVIVGYIMQLIANHA